MLSRAIGIVFLSGQPQAYYRLILRGQSVQPNMGNAAYLDLIAALDGSTRPRCLPKNAPLAIEGDMGFCRRPLATQGGDIQDGDAGPVDDPTPKAIVKREPRPILMPLAAPLALEDRRTSNSSDSSAFRFTRGYLSIIDSIYVLICIVTCLV